MLSNLRLCAIFFYTEKQLRVLWVFFLWTFTREINVFPFKANVVQIPLVACSAFLAPFVNAKFNIQSRVKRESNVRGISEMMTFSLINCRVSIWNCRNLDKLYLFAVENNIYLWGPTTKRSLLRLNKLFWCFSVNDCTSNTPANYSTNGTPVPRSNLRRPANCSPANRSANWTNDVCY